MKELIRKNGLLAGMLLISISLSFGQDLDEIRNNPAYGDDPAAREECAMNLSIMSEYVKIKSYNLAVDSWQQCLENCPKSSKNIYIYGARIANYKIENAKDEESRNRWIDSLMLVYDMRIEHFGQPGFVYGKKGLDLLKYRQEAAMEEAYEYLGKSVDLREEEVSEAVAATYITVTDALFQSGLVGADAMISNYVRVMEALEQKISDGDDDPDILAAIESVEKVFAESGAAGCESLIEIYTPKFEAAPEDVEMLKKIISLLVQTGCKDAKLFADASEALYALEPSASAAANLAEVFLVRGDESKGIEYFQKAIQQETDNTAKAGYYYQLALLAAKNGNKQLARHHALSALSSKPDLGNAYILIGDVYASSAESCGSTDFEKRAVYWAAVDKYIRAKSVDASVAETASMKISVYSQNFPNSDDVFFLGYHEGDSYTVGCWINEKTKVRTTN